MIVAISDVYTPVTPLYYGSTQKFTVRGAVPVSGGARLYHGIVDFSAAGDDTDDS